MRDGFEKIHSQLEQLEALGRAHHSMERELDAFLAEYYARILPLCEKLERLKQGCDDAPELNRPYLPAAESRKASLLDERIKNLYRKLIKTHHPDNQQQKSSEAVAGSIIAAYSEKSVRKLWLMEMEIICRGNTSPLFCAQYIALQQKEITAQLYHMQAACDALSASAVWRLKENVFNASLQGIDLISLIAGKITMQIEEAQLRLHALAVADAPWSRTALHAITA